MGCRTSSIKKNTFGMGIDSLSKKYVFEDVAFDDYTISEQDCLDHYSGQLSKIPFIAVDGKNIPINETVIKENMALVNSIIGNREFEKLTRDDIDEILTYEHKEYNVLFDFINHYLPDCDLLKLVYCICEICLNIYFSEQIIGSILRLIQKESARLSRMETDKIIYLIRDVISYDIVFSKLFSIIHEQAIKATTNLFNCFDFSKNQFIRFVKDFYNFLIRGIEYRATQKTLYVNKLTNYYIQNLTTVIGCPVIFFREENEYRGLSNTPEYFFNDFIYLHGALKIFTQLYYFANVTQCPFRERNICKIPKNDKCCTNCLDNYEDELYKNCLLNLFDNSLFLPSFKINNATY